MAPEERALATVRALVPAGSPAGDPIAAAQARLAAALEEVAALDAEVEALSAALAAFAREVERRLGAPDEAARRAASLVRRLQALADGLARELARVREAADAGPRGRARPKAKGRAGAEAAPDLEGDEDPDSDSASDGAASAAPEAVPELEGFPAAAEAAARGAEAAAMIKRLYRRLARLLHPDLAPDDAERARLSVLMARANAAYEADDLAELEHMAARLGAGEPPGELTAAERLEHLERRAAQLARVAASLGRERDRLARSETARLRAEAARRAEAGGDYFTESEAELAEEAGAARADALARLDAVARVARELSSARRKTMADLERRGAGGVRRAFDPLAESALVRRSVARLERGRATAEARALARWLEGGAAPPWEAGLTLLAFLMEEGGARPPPAVASADGLAGRWERLRPGWPGAPDLAGALSRLPRHLSLGARVGGGEVVAGLQLAEASLAAGVRLALGHQAVAALARQVLAVLGPEAPCRACRREVLGVHLLLTSGLDERHGVECPRCGEALRSYWRYGEAEGLEALWPVALAVGHVAEQPVGLGGTSIGFGMRPEERQALTARGLVERLEALYLEPYQVALPKGAVRVAGRSGLLEPRARVAGAGRLAFRLGAGAGATADGLVELLRTRIERRFKPGGAG